MEKLRACSDIRGEEIIEKVTEVPAQNFHLKTKGQIKEGFDADFTDFELINQPKETNRFQWRERQSNQRKLNQYKRLSEEKVMHAES